MFPAKETKNDDFSILIRKRDAYKKKYVHFTIVASTTGKQIRLETGITHYETLPKNGDSAEYIFEFDKKQDYVMNFYTHNAKKQDVSIKLLVSAIYRKKRDDIT